MAFEQTGLEAVIKNLQPYLNGVKQMDAATAKLLNTQISLATASAAVSRAQDSVGTKLAENARRTEQAISRVDRVIQNRQLALAETVDNTTDRIRRAEARAARDRERATNIVTKDIGVRQAAIDKAADSEIILQRVRDRASLQVLQQSRAVQEAVETKNNIIANSEAKAAAIQAAGAVTSEAATAKHTRALIANAAAGGLAAGSFNTLGKASLALGVAQKGLNAITQKTGELLIAMTGFANRFAVSLRFGVAAVTAFTTAFVFREAAQFQDVLTKIDNLTNATSEETRQLGKDILNLTKTIPKSPDELGAAAYFALSSGIESVDTAQQIVIQSAKAATAGFASTEEVVKTTTAVIKAYGEENIKASQVTDILFAATKEGRAEFQDFATQIGRVIPLASTMGITFDQVAAATAVLTNSGLQSSQAVTALLGVMNQIFSPSDAAKEILIELGTSIEEVRKSIREDGLLKAMDDLFAKTGNNIQVIEELFPEVRGLGGALTLFSTQAEEAVRVQGRVAKSVGTVDEAFKNSQKTLSFQVGLIRNGLNRALIELGAKVLPVVTKALEDVQKFFVENEGFINEFINRIGDVIKVFGIAIATISKFVFELLGAKGVIIAAGLAIAGVLLVALGPIPISIGIIIASIGLLIQNFDAIKAKAIETWGSLPDIVSRPIQFIASFIVNQIAGIVTVVKTFFELFKEQISLVVNLFQGDWKEAWEDFKDIGKLALEAFSGVVQTIFGQMANNIIDLTEKGVNGAIEAIERGAKAITEFRPASVFGFSPDLNPLPNVSALGSIPRVSGIPRVEIQGTTIFKEGVEEADKAAKKAGESAKEYAEQGLKPGAAAFNDAAIKTKKATDAIKDGIISFEEAAELGLSAIQAGALEASRILDESKEKAFEFTKALAKVANGLAVSANATLRFVKSLSQDALDKARSALSAIFSSPTKEIAALDAALARLHVTNSRVISDLEKQLAAIDKSQEVNQIALDLNAVGAEIRAAGTDPQLRGAAFAKQAELFRQNDIKRQRDAIQAEIDKRKESEDSIQRQIDQFNLQNEALQKSILASDATLKSQAELETAAREIAGIIQTQSQAIRDISRALGEDVLKEINAMRDAANLASGALAILENDSIRQQFIPAVNDASTAVNGLKDVVVDAAKTIEEKIKALETPRQNILPPRLRREDFDSFQHGGFVNDAVTNATLHGPEVVLPLSQPSRSRELMMSLPPNLLRQIVPSGPQIGSVVGSIPVTGVVTQDMETAIVSAVRRQLARQRGSLRMVGL